MQLYHIASIWKTILLGLALSVSSCIDDHFENNPLEPGIPVRVELNFRVPKFDPPKAAESRAATKSLENTFHVDLLSNLPNNENIHTKSSTRTTDSPLYNLWVFQFAADGTKRKIIRASTNDNPVYENQTIEVELLTGENQTIYLLSMGKRYDAIDLSMVNSIDELESTPFDFVRYENGLPTAVIKNAEDVPYRGSCSNLSIIKLEENGKGYVDYNNSNAFGGAINMKALVSLVTIDFTYQVDKMTPFCISLNNVATTFVVNDTTYKPSQFVNLPVTMLDPADLTNGKRVSLSWYVAPNPQGVVPSISSEADRYFYYTANSTTPTGIAPRDGTFIHLWASTKTNPDNYALYYLFLGSNTTNDFNIHPHSHYRYRTDINTADDLNDKRIIYKTLKQTIDFSASAIQKSQSPLRGGSAYDFDAHPDMRPIELTALRGSVSVEILPGSDNGAPPAWPAAGVAPIDRANSWLKLSTYPNYTAAHEADKRSDPNALTTSITLNAAIPGVFRLYLYSDEYTKYIQDNASDATQKRSLFVRFTFNTATNQSEVYTARMDQRRAFYIGEFGGDPAMVNGEFRYPKGLVVESTDESVGMRHLSYIPDRFNMYGGYVGISAADIRRYGAYDTHNGRSATIMMAENTHHISPIAAGNTYVNKIEEPRYVNGHVDLYQYKYYTGDGFAQRWCYDKNRDTNGNGRLDNDEVVWYLPSIWQLYSIPLNCYNTKTNYLQNSNSQSGFGTSHLHSSTLYNAGNRLTFKIYDMTLVNNSSSNAMTVRCVRDVEPLTGASTGVRYYEEDSYPVIDATGLMEGATEDRVNNPSVIIQPTVDDSLYKGRVIRHYTPESTSTPSNVHPIVQKVSRRFRVAPCDVDTLGNPVIKGSYHSMHWAQASGYAPEANTLPVVEGNKTAIANTGCAAYKGKNGTDAEGTWRLPTPREVLLIAMMDKGMEADKARTGYIPLFYYNDRFGCRYWTSTEIPDGTGPYSLNRALCLYAAGDITMNNDTGNKNAWYISKQAKSNTTSSTPRNLARCIQDLH